MSKKTKKLSTVETIGIVEKVIRETPDTVTLRIVMSNLKEEEKPFIFKPGQFVMVKPNINNKTIPRAYSISSSPTKAYSDENYIDLTVRQTEKPVVSKWLNDRIENDEILFKGPYGQFYWDSDNPQCSQLLLIAGGSGVTPLKSIIEYISDKRLQNRSKLLYSSRTQEDIILRNPLEEIESKNKNIKVEFFLTREPAPSNWDGKRGRISEQQIKETLQEFDLEKTGCYLCGTPAFVVSMSVYLKDAGISEEKIFFEKW